MPRPTVLAAALAAALPAAAPAAAQSFNIDFGAPGAGPFLSDFKPFAC